MNSVEFVVHNRTKERGLIKAVTTLGYSVQWLKSGVLTDVSATDLTVVEVAVPHAQHTNRKLKRRHIEMLEKTFATLTPEGWVIPIWIDLLRP